MITRYGSCIKILIAKHVLVFPFFLSGNSQSVMDFLPTETSPCMDNTIRPRYNTTNKLVAQIPQCTSPIPRNAPPFNSTQLKTFYWHTFVHLTTLWLKPNWVYLSQQSTWHIYKIRKTSFWQHRLVGCKTKPLQWRHIESDGVSNP